MRDNTQMMKKGRKSNKAGIVARSEQSMLHAYRRMDGLDIKADNIARVYGYVPATVQQELDEAEMEYNFHNALWNDNRSDPYL